MISDRWMQRWRSWLTGQQLFRLWLGVTEYLFRKPGLLDEVIVIAVEDNTFRSDDLEFTFAARVPSGLSLKVCYQQRMKLTDRIVSSHRAGLTAFPLVTFHPTRTALSRSNPTSHLASLRQQESATR